MDDSLNLEVIRDEIEAAQAAISQAEDTVRIKREEIADLLAAQRVLARRAGTWIERVVDAVAAEPSRSLGNRYRSGTTKFFIYEALWSTQAVWATANDVQAAASELKGAEIPMGTISPSLTEMKDEEIVVRDGWRVSLAVRANETRPPAESETTHYGGGDLIANG